MDMQELLANYFSHRHRVAASCEIEHKVYVSGVGPPLLILQELPGIGPQTLRLAEALTSQGFSVYLPHLFGPLGETQVVRNLARVLCMRKELAIFQRGKSSPIVDWLRALSHVISQRRAGQPVGVIGMCLTGNFAISLLTEPCVRAAVASQPSLPVLAPSDLHITEGELINIRERMKELEPVHLYRFEEDPLCPPEKAKAYELALNRAGERHLIVHNLPGRAHSVFTLDFVDEQGHPTRVALEEVIAYFKRALCAHGVVD